MLFVSFVRYFWHGAGSWCWDPRSKEGSILKIKQILPETIWINMSCVLINKCIAIHWLIQNQLRCRMYRDLQGYALKLCSMVPWYNSLWCLYLHCDEMMRQTIKTVWNNLFNNIFTQHIEAETKLSPFRTRHFWYRKAQIMALGRPGDKLFSEPTVANLRHSTSMS